jgi:hypothetical protein
MEALHRKCHVKTLDWKLRLHQAPSRKMFIKLMQRGSEGKPTADTAPTATGLKRIMAPRSHAAKLTENANVIELDSSLHKM